MIAETARENCNNIDMASTSDSKTCEGQKEEEENGRPESNPAPTPTPTPTPAPTNGEVLHEDQVIKDEDDGHMSSEDEDKLIINENCDKKEALKQDANVRVVAPAESVASGSQGDSNEMPPKSPLKRPVEDTDVSGTVSKKPRIADELDHSMLSGPQIDESLAVLKSDLRTLDMLIAQKEEEWNALIRLQKKKEEIYLRLSRKRQVLKMRGFAKKDEEVADEEEEEEEEENVMFLPQGAYASLGNSQFPLMMMKHMLGENYMSQVNTSSRSSHMKESSNPNGPLTPQSNISVIDIHTNNSKPRGPSELPQISISPEAHSKLGKHLNSMISMKPILPKPLNCVGGVPNSGGTPPPLSFPPTGYGPQGPTVSVHHLIAAHRKDNPNIPPIRGAKRGAWRHRYEGEKRSSPREPDRPSSVSSSNSETEVRVNPSMNLKANFASNINNNNNNLLTMNDPSVSYKDVLLQFAQLTQTEKQPGSPQISIIPVSSADTPSRKLEHTPDSTSVSRELSVPAQSTNQSQNLEGSSALAKLLLESGAGNHGSVSKAAAVDLSSYNSSPHCLTLSALLSGGTTTTHKDKITSVSQIENRPKKNVSTEDTNTKCQGCHKHRAQFVCAGCSNQWYCSRNCQVTAWEKHSEHCSS